MLRFNATRYLNMGGLITDMTGHFGLREGSKNESERARHDDEFRRDLGRIYKLANELNLKTTAQLIEPRLKALPQSEGEYNLLIECLYNELNNRLFFYTFRLIDRNIMKAMS
ncbi:hypothetical protein [Bosea sp. R86505]|uniref:hypothetical protein n=1 Tax=Bosea sp. R86505 TaxID=3101710 RepID=UPI003670E748